MQYSENYIPQSEEERKLLDAEQKQKEVNATRLQELRERLEGLAEDDLQAQAIRDEIESLENPK